MRLYGRTRILGMCLLWPWPWIWPLVKAWHIPGSWITIVWNIIQIQHGSEELWPGQGFWVCVHCDIHLGNMTLGQGHYTPLGHGQQLCEILSRSDKGTRSYGPDMMCTDERTDGQTDRLIPIYPQTLLGITIQPNLENCGPPHGNKFDQYLTKSITALLKYRCLWNTNAPLPQHDLWPTDLKINRDHLLIKDYLPTKFEASGSKRSWVISCTRLRETDIPTDRPTCATQYAPPFSKGDIIIRNSTWNWLLSYKLSMTLSTAIKIWREVSCVYCDVTRKHTLNSQASAKIWHINLRFCFDIPETGIDHC